MDKAQIVMLLAALVVIGFFLFPSLGGIGKDQPIFTVAPSTDTMEVPTEVPCNSVPECVQAAVAQGAPANITAKCTANKCVFVTERFLWGESP